MSFQAYFRKLLKERGINGYAELAQQLEEAGYPYDRAEVAAYVAGAGQDEWPLGHKVWVRGVRDVLELDTKEAMAFSYSYIFDMNPRDEAAKKTSR